MMKILVACEFSGAVRDAFRRKGHDAWSCDLEHVEPEGEFPHYHLYGDARWFLPNGGTACSQEWDMLIAHPPCKYLTNAGGRWLYNGGRKDNGPNIDRWLNMAKGVEFFKELWIADIPHKAFENPIMHKYSKELIGMQQTQVVQPWQFGHMEQKATCWWLHNLPTLVDTNNVYDEMMKLPYKERAKVHYESPGPDREKNRSRTYPGMAEAMATQWGSS